MSAVRSAELARELSELRRASGLTLREVGRKVGRSPGFLADVFNGKTDISQVVLMELAHALGGDVTVLRGMWVEAFRRQSFGLIYSRR